MDIEFDWNDAWKCMQAERRHADDSTFWDRRAPSFAKTAGTSPYAHTFLERSGVQPGQTVFDMGCGSGTLALPLARRGIEVWAADFSSVMIELMMRRAEVDGTAELIHPINLAWDESWAERGLPVCDLAFASRSIATADLQAALTKLDSRARQRVCITLGTGISPRIDEVLLDAVGRQRSTYSDYIFGMNILWQMGLQPELSYIRSSRDSEFESPAHAVDKTCELIEATPDERERLEAYSREHLVQRKRDDGTTYWTYDHTRVTSWAFISWNKEMS